MQPIEIRTSKTADTRTCDVKTVTKEQLYESSVALLQSRVAVIPDRAV